jgi:hypothetical protein
VTYRSLERANAYFYDPARRLAVLRRHGAVRYMSSGVNHLKAPTVLLEIAARELTERRLVENYTAPGGAPALLAAIAFETHERVGGQAVRGAVGLANIAVTAGATGALAAAFRYMAEVAGARKALVLGLNYSYFSAICDECGIVYRTACSAEAGRILPSLAEAAECLARERPDIVVLTQPTNPSGEAYEAGELARLVALVEDAGAWLIFDEVPDLAWPDEPDPPHPLTGDTLRFPERIALGQLLLEVAQPRGVEGRLDRRRRERDSLRAPSQRAFALVAGAFGRQRPGGRHGAAFRRAAGAGAACKGGGEPSAAAIDAAVTGAARHASRYLRLFSPLGRRFRRLRRALGLPRCDSGMAGDLPALPRGACGDGAGLRREPSRLRGKDRPGPHGQHPAAPRLQPMREVREARCGVGLREGGLRRGRSRLLHRERLRRSRPGGQSRLLGADLDGKRGCRFRRRLRDGSQTCSAAEAISPGRRSLPRIFASTRRIAGSRCLAKK